MDKGKFLATTESICPECLQVVPARKMAHGDQVYLVKKCVDHSVFRTLIWDGKPDHLGWDRERLPAQRGEEPHGLTRQQLG